MNGKSKVGHQNTSIDVKIIFSALWTTLMVLYGYCDILSLYRTGQIESIIHGKMGFLDVTQGNLAIASGMMIVPALMIAASPLLDAKFGRIANIVAGILYLLVNLGNVLNETWVYYFLFAGAEILVTILIIYKSIKWPKTLS